MLDVGGEPVRLKSDKNILEVMNTSQNIFDLPDHEKYLILKNHFVPDEQYQFPKTLKHGCQRSCSLSHLKQSFVYSKMQNSVHCIYCALFISKEKRNKLSSFVNHGYSEWHNILEKESRHLHNSYHEDSVQKAYGVLERYDNPGNTIPAQLDESLKSRYEIYPQIIEIVARVVHLLGKQGLAFRG